MRHLPEWVPKNESINENYEHIKVIYDPPLAAANVYLVRNRETGEELVQKVILKDMLVAS
jgi:hypothetical protein